MITLNPEQSAAVKYLSTQFISQPAQRAVLLGEGGTGKSTCIMSAAQAWRKAGLKVMFCAPTHKAVKQLEKFAANAGLSNSAAFCTLHKALGLALLPTSERKFSKQVAEPILHTFDIVVLDEGSMVSKYAVFDYLLPALGETSLVVMGDKMQLPPVREQSSPALELGGATIMELTKVERFSQGSSIAEITSALRKTINSGSPLALDLTQTSAQVVRPVEFMKTILERFDSDTNLENTRVLAWTNSRVNTINAAIREKIYGRRAAMFELGEQVVTGAPIYDELGELLMSTDEECLVRGVQESSLHYSSNGKTYKTFLLALESLHTNTATTFAHVIHPSDEMELMGDLEDLANKARRDPRMWGNFHQLKDLFADIKYCYAVTVHRSQGSTYETCIVDAENILRNRNKAERDKLLYVACSRASKELLINKTKLVS